MGVELAALLIAGLFVASGLGHIRDYAGFASTLSAYRLVPIAAGRWTAAAVIAVEVGAAGLVVATGPVAQAGLVMLGGLAAAGAILITFDFLTGNRSHGCGCLGDAHGSLSGWKAFRSAVVAACAVSLAVLGPSSGALRPVAGALLLMALTLGWIVVIAATTLYVPTAEPIDR